MTYPVWSGINAEQINSTDVNGVAPTPLIVVDGFSSAIFPVLLGTYPGLYAEVVKVRNEDQLASPISEERDLVTVYEGQDVAVLPELNTVGVERSRKDYP